MLERLEELLGNVRATDWRGCKLRDCANREEMLRHLADGWINGPNSSASECFFILGTEPDGEEVTTAMIGNGPQRYELTQLITLAINSLPDLLAVARCAEEMLEGLGAEMDDCRLAYVLAQINRADMKNLETALAKLKEVTDA
jgi:hypothetical protein